MPSNFLEVKVDLMYHLHTQPSEIDRLTINEILDIHSQLAEIKRKESKQYGR